MSAPQPSSAQAIVGVAAVAAGAFAAYYVKPDQVIDYTIAKTSSAYTNLGYAAQDNAEGHKRRGFLERTIRGVNKFVDENALALEWKLRQQDFDDASPIKSQTIVTVLIGLATFALTKRLVGSAIR